MKTFNIIILLLIAAIGSHAQTIKIKSKSVLADSIWVVRSAIEIAPTPTGSGSDTIRSIIYQISPGRDTLGSMSIQIYSYNKSAGLIATDYITASQTLYSRWKSLITAIDTYILAQRKRLVKQ